jgi:hypothetical protein
VAVTESKNQSHKKVQELKLLGGMFQTQDASRKPLTTGVTLSHVAPSARDITIRRDDAAILSFYWQHATI